LKRVYTFFVLLLKVSELLSCSLNSFQSICSPDYLKPIAAEERRIEEEEKKLREERERIYKQLSEGL